jgi:hypothetical protein
MTTVRKNRCIALVDTPGDSWETLHASAMSNSDGESAAADRP